MANSSKSSTWMERLRRQEIWTWRPVPTVKFALIVYISIAIVFLPLGIALLVESSKLHEVATRYDDTPECALQGQNCTLAFEVTDDLTAPIYVYYRLTNFYQNHRLYFKSRNPDQLSGDDLDVSDISSCEPITKVKDLGKIVLSLDNRTIEEEAPANPCGLIAKSVFNDTYALISPSNVPVVIDESDIAWTSDEDKFGRPSDYKSLQWTNVESDHFKVWLRTAATSDFRKIWGKIEENLPKGVYTLEIANNYDMSRWKGEKHFVLATTSRFGGKHYLLGGLFVAGAGFSLVIAVVFLLVSRRNRSKTLEEYFPESEAVFTRLKQLLNGPRHMD